MVKFFHFLKICFIICFFSCFSLTAAEASPTKGDKKVKFYNFDDLLINGEYKKPQVLYIDKKQKVKFEKLLKLKRDFLSNLKDTEKDPVLR